MKLVSTNCTKEVTKR